ncbi:hypothetical protein AQS8620_01404 [Aquimixticola soesokkakensis]|uniref:Uncharacterized protein n=2 Tax=Aquimixticola soesokkakensis TaxID=1519096 RepID=A0A1Y5SDE8_9RHOB|nr:hypothetical protein AQS8620_01404 [Aquimixticola soesokkakensis]
MTSETDHATAYAPAEPAPDGGEAAAVIASYAPLVLGAAERIDLPQQDADVDQPEVRDEFFARDPHLAFYSGEELDPNLSLEARIAELEAAVSSYADEFEPDGSEDQTDTTPTAMILSYPKRQETPAAQDTRAEEHAQAAAHETSHADADDSGAQEADSAESGAQEDQHVIGKDEERDAQILSFVTARYAVDEGADVAPDTPEVETRDHDAQAESDTLVEVHDWLDAEITEDVVDLAELQALAAATLIENDEIESVETEEPVALAEDDALDIDFDQLEAQEPDFDEDEDLDAAGYADDVFDEEALRDLVTTIIREELQGTMGERITRNLRRLVRREVQRAMTLKDFE